MGKDVSSAFADEIPLSRYLGQTLPDRPADSKCQIYVAI
ncbi:MAG: hypothetical protein RLZZ568_1077 [Cyanobacteriota bacterium]|jgi:hypothetical protein